MPDDMSAEDMDAWAAQQNEIAAHNLRVLYADLIQFANRRNEDWRAPGVLEEQRAIRARYGIIRRHQGGGRRCSYDRAEIRERVQNRHHAHPGIDYNSVTATVAWGIEPKPGHTLKYVTRVVRRYTADMRW